jgi:predicted nucleic acid-binding protein
MADTVVDASVVAAIVFGEPRAQEALERLGDDRLIASEVLAYEISTVAWLKLRRLPALGNPIDDAFRAFEKLEIELVRMEPRVIVRMAIDHGLTAYDASYLVLAATRGAKIVTFDRELEAAARRLLSSPS